jgi:hypothetical protein
MSDFGRLAAIATPDLMEIGGRTFLNSEGKPAKPRLRRRPPSPNPVSPDPSLGKKETEVTTQNPTPEEIQASLNQELVKYVDARPTPEGKAEALIKIGAYRQDLNKYLPMLENADEDLANEVIGTWLDEGDAELKKMVFNAQAGSEEIALAKVAPPPAPEAELAKMVDDAPEGAPRMALLQKMGVYTSQLRELWDRTDALQVAEAERGEMIKTWVEGGDRSHEAMKKALVSAEGEMRRRASTEGVNHKDVVSFTAGNASTNADKLGGSGGSSTPDSGIRRSIPSPSSGDGAGKQMPGDTKMPDQNDGESPDPGSGPNDTGGGEVRPTTILRRKATTGGLGSVAGAESDGKAMETQQDQVKNKKKKKALAEAAEKGEDLAVALVKIAPEAMLDALEKLDEDEQIEVCEEAAHHAADLMAWSLQAGERLEKRALDAAVIDWLTEDPDPAAVQLKKFVAEALATAEEIPMDLGKAIMAWEPQAVPMAKVKSQIRVRQPHPMPAA